MTLGTNGASVVTVWHDIAATTLNATGSVATTPEERLPLGQIDMATVTLAMYDAASAIDRRYQPCAITPRSPAAGASMDAAISAAAHGVLRGLFPNRSAH
ncbi:MAG: hypothetical protein V4631_20500 [Pseudomonadota bacterium]